MAAATIHLVMTGDLFEEPAGALRRKLDKPDTVEGWATAKKYAEEGVPYGMLLHQRHYGGAFRQLLDATSTLRGDLIENAVQRLFEEGGVRFIRTGSHNQQAVEHQFEVAVRPAPDFVVYDQNRVLRGMLECKGANDGGTARDKALRFTGLRGVDPAQRHTAVCSVERTRVDASQRHTRPSGQRLRGARILFGEPARDARGRSLPPTARVGKPLGWPA